MSNTTCPRCSKSKADWAEVCWRCHVDDREQEAYDQGWRDALREAASHIEDRTREEYNRGYLAGLAACPHTASVLDAPRLRQLIQLCHPDRHGGSDAANDATKWLLEARKALKRAQA